MATSTTPTRVYLKDYRAPDHEIDECHLDFDLHEDHALVKSKLKIRTKNAGAPLRLDGEGLTLVSARVNGRDLSTAEMVIDQESLTLAKTPTEFELEITVRIEPQNNKALEGLYRSSGIFTTQCEAQGFRRITYFLDRPDIMTRYTVRLEAEKAKYPVLLSNGDRVHVKDLGNGRHEALWRDPHRKPCYLFALVAGDLGLITDSFTTMSGRKVNLEIYAAHGKQQRCLHAMESLKKSMKWDEERFGREYDLNDYMIVAIDDFNAGAMENKGLNIFNSRLVLADAETATDEDFKAIESVVAHEYFHNWTGNRVTLANWFHLSLKEGLTVFRDQEFSADVGDRGLQRIEDVDSLRERQFPEDAGPNAHPVRPESCLAVDNFFTATIYEKGSELIRMMQTTVGKKGFRAGMDLYFERHDGQAVTTDDFAAAIADANKADFSQLKLWYSQAGTPRVKVSETFDQSLGEYRLTLEQFCPPTPGQETKKPFQIPIRLGLLDRETGLEVQMRCKDVRLNTDGDALIELREARQEFVFEGLKSKPVASLLREFSAPVNLEWNRPKEDLYFLMSKDSDGFNRRESAQTAALRALSTLIAGKRQGRSVEVDPAYVATWSANLQLDLDPAYQATLLDLPSESLLAQNEEVLDAAAFREARTVLIRALVSDNRTRLFEIYRRWHGQDPRKTDTRAIGQRSLKNLALSLLCEAGDTEALSLAEAQFREARNMTDRLTALRSLVDAAVPAATAALEKFHRDWREDSVVINKWFSIQAMSQRPDTFEMVRALTKHPDFRPENPNNVYSLLRNFGQNLTVFHDPRRPGYAFLADWILQIDRMNPGVAARLCAAFNMAHKLPAELKEQARAEIRRVLMDEKLSRNTRELLHA